MGLLKWMLLTAIVLDAALVLSIGATPAASSPEQTIGYAMDGAALPNQAPAALPDQPMASVTDR